MKTLVCVGDSWPQGGELKDPMKAYGHLIQNQLAFDRFFNYGQPGASNEDSLLQFSKFVEKSFDPKDQTTLIVHLTNPARSLLWPDRQNWVNHQPANLRELFLHFHEYDDLRSSLTVTALQTWCKKLHVDDYYFSGWVKYSTWMPMVNTDKIWAQGSETAGDWFGAMDHNSEHLTNVDKNPYIKPNYCHPNELGHKLIADKLSDWILKNNKYSEHGVL